MSEPIATEIRSFSQEIRAEGLKREIDALREISFARSCLAFIFNWLVIAGAIWLVVDVSYWWIALAAIFIGSRQRAMSNLVHDGSHGNLYKNSKLNDLITDLAAALPMGETVRNYRKSHSKHHKYLGVMSDDPDLESHRRYGFDDFATKQISPIKTYFGMVFNWSSWRDSVAGSFPDLPKDEKLKTLAWWALTMTLLLTFGGLRLTAITPLVWIFSRATGYHVVRIFAEFTDHSGLKPGSVFGFTRNIPGAAWPMRPLIHPHSDNFHLIHHLMPKIPHYRLASAHRVLLRNRRYLAKGHHCDGYVRGRYSVLDSWARDGRTI